MMCDLPPLFVPPLKLEFKLIQTVETQWKLSESIGQVRLAPGVLAIPYVAWWLGGLALYLWTRYEIPQAYHRIFERFNRLAFHVKNRC